jgi:hypothetical protein
MKRVVLKAYYSLDDGYIPFDSNPLHNQTYENVGVTFKEEVRTICGIDFAVDVVEIDGQEPIDCELIGTYHEPESDTLIIKICQDWG